MKKQKLHLQKFFQKKRTRGVAVLVFLSALLFSIVALAPDSPQSRDALAGQSSEYNYFNTSPLGDVGGLAIPASCPSDLHDEPNYGQVCNSCGTIQCGGICSIAAPSANFGQPCTSGANACGMTTSGTIQCNGSCSATTTPPNSACPLSCGATHYNCIGGTAALQTETATEYTWQCRKMEYDGELKIWFVAGTRNCNEPKGACVPTTGNACTSAPNLCGMTNSGVIACSGACTAVTPSDTLCGAASYRICPQGSVLIAGSYQFHSYYNPSGPVDCNNPTAAGTIEATGGVTWSSSNTAVVTIGASTGTATAAGPSGSSTISTTPYLGLSSPSVTATVSSCFPSNNCFDPVPAAQTANMCPSQSFWIDDGCLPTGNDMECFGTRTCDFNWKEVGQ